jgi:hypothetical protein
MTTPTYNGTMGGQKGLNIQAYSLSDAKNQMLKITFSNKNST